MNWTNIDYGIVGAVVLALLSLFAFVVKTLLKSTTDSKVAARQTEFADLTHRLEENKNTIVAKGEEVLSKLQERCIACSYDHDKMVESINSLSSSIAQLTVVVKYVLDIKKDMSNG